MLKKNTPVKFSRPGTVMQTVYEAVRDGTDSKHMLIVKTKLKPNQVTAALTNLTFTGMIACFDTKAGSRYALPDSTRYAMEHASQNSLRVHKNRGGRPVNLDKQRRIYITPKSTAAREAFYRLGGSRWINRILEGLA